MTAIQIVETHYHIIKERSERYFVNKPGEEKTVSAHYPGIRPDNGHAGTSVSRCFEWQRKFVNLPGKCIM
ncbi:MAG: hypothetical protein VR69_14740 [Peptococcaceae bacterium BRH_c4b]|nr:MAG: hypothetical protein VR69_14740 [Peptococcaceae bacterium BRH_c4b]